MGHSSSLRPRVSRTYTFWYRVANSAGSDTAQVAINVGNVNGMVWFVSSSASGTGRQGSPMRYTSLASTNNGAGTNPAAGDTIFLFEGSYAGVLALLSNQKLIGQDATVSVPTLGGPAAQPGNAYEAINPSGASVSLPSLTLGSGNTIAGFTAGGAGTAIGGSVVGSLSVREVAINGTGPALIVSTSATGVTDSTFTGFTSVTGTTVSLAGLAGTLNLGTGTLSGAGGVGLSVNGGNGSITYAGTIQNSGTRQVIVNGKTGGTVTLSGPITGTGTGVSLAGNSGATITFSGGLALSTGSTDAFVASGGGTIAVCDKNPCGFGSLVTNTLATSTGTALNVSNATIGGSGLTFRSISANGGSKGLS